jgi:hypothetical protein
MMDRRSVPRFAALLPGLLVLAACGGGSEADYNRVEVPEAVAEAQNAIDAAVIANGAATTARAGVPVTKPSANAARGRALPKEFQGYWGVTPNDCELANTDATGRINVDADTIRFYESKARVLDVLDPSPYAVTTDLRFEGEGETWQRRTEWKLANGGTTLVRRDGGQTVRYSRC